MDYPEFEGLLIELRDAGEKSGRIGQRLLHEYGRTLEGKKAQDKLDKEQDIAISKGREVMLKLLEWFVREHCNG